MLQAHGGCVTFPGSAAVCFFAVGVVGADRQQCKQPSSHPWYALCGWWVTRRKAKTKASPAQRSSWLSQHAHTRVGGAGRCFGLFCAFAGCLRGCVSDRRRTRPPHPPTHPPPLFVVQQGHLLACGGVEAEGEKNPMRQSPPQLLPPPTLCHTGNAHTHVRAHTHTRSLTHTHTFAHLRARRRTHCQCRARLASTETRHARA